MTVRMEVADHSLLDDARALAARAASGPRQLARRLTQTVRSMSAVAAHDAAVDVELDAQLWSMAQPEFAERLAAMQQRIRKG